MSGSLKESFLLHSQKRFRGDERGGAGYGAQGCGIEGLGTLSPGGGRGFDPSLTGRWLREAKISQEWFLVAIGKKKKEKYIGGRGVCPFVRRDCRKSLASQILRKIAF